MNLEDAIEYAAENLQRLVTISVHVEGGAAWVTMHDGNRGGDVDIEAAGVSVDQPLADQIVAAVDAARAQV